MKASIIVLSWNGIDYIADCLDGVLSQGDSDFEVIVVDNGSSDGSADFVAQHYPQVRLIRHERNLGFAAGNNAGLRTATGDVLVLLNQDTVVQPGWLAACVEALEGCPDAGIVGAKILGMDGCTLQHAGGYVEHPLALGKHYGYGERDAGQYDEPRRVEFVTGAAMAFKREVLSQIGLLDEGFYPGYFEDVDFCYRARAVGYAVWYVPQAVLHHHESASMRRDSYRGHCYYYRNRLRFVLKHYTVFQIARQFVPAESERVAHMPLEELRAAARSTIEGMLLWPLVAWHHRPLPTQEEYESVLAALRTLQETVLERGERIGRHLAVPVRGSPESESASPALQPQETVPVEEKGSSAAEPARPGGVPSTAEEAPEPTSARELIAPFLPGYDSGGEIARSLGSEIHQQLRHELHALNLAWEVTPRPFTSDVTILGPLIVALRDLVNNLATRWYVQALLDQQVAFNANVTRLLNAQATESEDWVRRNARLFDEVAHVARQHGALLQQHDALLQHHNQWMYDQGQSSAVLAEQVAVLQWQLLALQAQVSKLEAKIYGRGDALESGGDA